MDYLKLSSSMGHQAQALLALHRTAEEMLANRFGKSVTVKASQLQRMSAALRQGAELADSVSILLDQAVEVPVKA